ncbi:transglycosylase SLT domain-containing protein [Methylosarcina fibrata]|uniref:transglycosylase SLT domain-containing protein n=1 Tax=Methylosarcina fibrata TaxID=105972 RepID=UPI00037DF315|nr:transglycosylase SLT domain-containing protein [Methylosarcina fibrata]
MRNFVLGVVLTCFPVFVPAAVSAPVQERQRQDFLLAEKMISSGDDPNFFRLSAGLTDYPLYPYLQYQWLKEHLAHTGKILDFLQTYRETRYADLLRSRWLVYLADHQRWQEFVQYFSADGDLALECRWHWANYNLGHRDQALAEARRLWSLGASQPPACEPLFSLLVVSSQLTPDLIWQRFELALTADRVPLADYLRRLLDGNERQLADVWMRIHQQPKLIQKNPFPDENDPRLGRLFAHAVERLARTDLDLAVGIWDANKQHPLLDSRTVQRIERNLALALAYNHKPDAYRRLNQLPDSDKEVREWKVRAALLEQDWRRINEALSGLAPEELKETRWQYWQARSLAAKGERADADNLYLKLAEDRSFYGFLAADAAARPYSLSDKPVSPAANDIEALAAATAFRAAYELRYLNRPLEAERQWWHAVKKLNKERLTAAAKLAQSWHWDSVAIKTLAKADYWDDLALRFPLGYMPQVQNNAYRYQLDPAVVLGLMRQESMLDSNALSPVGARGLMQLMPKTGRQIAQELKERWSSENSLFNPDVNISYGAYYYKSLLNRYNGHAALATAAYNAGPARVAKWLPQAGPMAADVWIETIPYKETRKYVISVLSYVIIYQHRMQEDALKMKDFMRDIPPG